MASKTVQATRTQWVYFFGDALPAGAEGKLLLGGKGASLAEMTDAGLRVPPGFTITTECCQWFYENGQTWPPQLEAQVREHLARLEQATGRQFGHGAKPLLVSVRSGAAVSMPGMMDTILNCGLHPPLAAEVGDTPRYWETYCQFIHMFAKTVAGVEPHGEGSGRDRAMAMLADYRAKAGREFPTEPWQILVECINAVFRSWNSERAIAYRKRNDIRGVVGTAVNVQAMWPSRVSGVTFTQNPNNLPANEIIIEGSYGLGEAVVSGDVTPDRFVIDRKDFSKVQTFIGNKITRVSSLDDTDGQLDPKAASLSPAQLRELCEISLQVEKYFGDKPMDIEWGWADGKFAVLQCRPIRGLEVAQDVEVGRQAEIAQLKAICGSQRRVWITHNLGETLRAPTPLTWDIIRHFMSGYGGYGLMYRDFGYRPSDEARREGFLELICGRIYADPIRAADQFWAHFPKKYDLKELLKDKSLIDGEPGQMDPERASGKMLIKLPATFWAMFRSSRIMKKARKSAKETFEEQILPAYRRYIAEKRSQDLTNLSTADVIRELNDRRAKVLDEFGKESLKPAYFGALAMGEAQKTLDDLMGKPNGAVYTNELLTGLDGDITFEQNAMLYAVSQGKATIDQFLNKFGHRASGEMELANARWREDRAYIERLVDQVKAGPSPDDTHHANVAKRETAQANLPRVLKEWGGASFQEDIEKSLAEARVLLPYRETGKYYLMMGYELIRAAILELSRRWDLGNDIFYLQLPELPVFEQNRPAMMEQIKARKTRWQSMQRLDMPDVIDSEKVDCLGLPEEIASTGELKGDAVAAGIATGPARIVFDPRNAGDIGTGYILVCPSTDPGWTPLFINARGLVVERGGILSHGAIVARDFGIPAVVCPKATTLIKNGATVKIDGNSGKITIVKE